MCIKFNTIIKKHPTQDATYIEIPFDVEKEFGAKRVKVVATFDGVEYRGSIVKMGLPCYMIGIPKAIRTQLGKIAGDELIVTIKKDEELREVNLPEEFQQMLNKKEEANQFYQTLSYSAKKKYYQWLTSAKKLETREKRMHEAITKLEQHIKL